MTRRAFAVAVGGVIGATARWLLGTATDDATITLLIANTVGAAVLGVVVNQWRSDHIMRAALGAGLCGGLTTFSGLTLAVAQRLDAGNFAAGAGLVLVSFGLGIAGFSTGRRVTT